jgi:hypothetical protein
MKTRKLFFDHEHYYRLEFYDSEERKMKKELVEKTFWSFKGAENKAIEILRRSPSLTFAVIVLNVFYSDDSLGGRGVAKVEILPDRTPSISEYDISLLKRF